jgi:hypothetical protein
MVPGIAPELRNCPVVKYDILGDFKMTNVNHIINKMYVLFLISFLVFSLNRLIADETERTEFDILVANTLFKEFNAKKAKIIIKEEIMGNSGDTILNSL